MRPSLFCGRIFAKGIADWGRLFIGLGKKVVSLTDGLNTLNMKPGWRLSGDGLRSQWYVYHFKLRDILPWEHIDIGVKNNS